MTRCNDTVVEKITSNVNINDTWMRANGLFGAINKLSQDIFNWFLQLICESEMFTARQKVKL